MWVGTGGQYHPPLQEVSCESLEWWGRGSPWPRGVLTASRHCGWQHYAIEGGDPGLPVPCRCSPMPFNPAPFSWPLAARGKPRRGMLRRAVFSDVQRKALSDVGKKSCEEEVDAFRRDSPRSAFCHSPSERELLNSVESHLSSPSNSSKHSDFSESEDEEITVS